MIVKAYVRSPHYLYKFLKIYTQFGQIKVEIVVKNNRPELSPSIYFESVRLVIDYMSAVVLRRLLHLQVDITRLFHPRNPRWSRFDHTLY